MENKTIYVVEILDGKDEWVPVLSVMDEDLANAGLQEWRSKGIPDDRSRVSKSTFKFDRQYRDEI